EVTLLEDASGLLADNTGLTAGSADANHFNRGLAARKYRIARGVRGRSAGHPCQAVINLEGQPADDLVASADTDVHRTMSADADDFPIHLAKHCFVDVNAVVGELLLDRLDLLADRIPLLTDLGELHVQLIDRLLCAAALILASLFHGLQGFTRTLGGAGGV